MHLVRDGDVAVQRVLHGWIGGESFNVDAAAAWKTAAQRVLRVVVTDSKVLQHIIVR